MVIDSRLWRSWPPLAATLLLLLHVGLLAQQAPSAPAKVIRIEVINARSGKQIKDECVNIFLGSAYNGTAMVAGPGRGGVIVLRVLDGWLTDDTPCKTRVTGWATKLRLPPGLGALVITGSGYVDCQEYAEPPGLPSISPKYPIKEILSKGMVSGNTCGKVRAKPVPGELIFFERPLTFWEKMTR